MPAHVPGEHNVARSAGAPRATAAPAGIDWGPAYEASHDLAVCALDIAEGQARGFREELRRVRKVRRFVDATFAGKRCAPPADNDVVFTVGLLIAALEVDCAEPGVIDAIEAALFGYALAQREAPIVPLFRNAPPANAPALLGRWAA